MTQQYNGYSQANSRMMMGTALSIVDVALQLIGSGSADLDAWILASGNWIQWGKAFIHVEP